MKLLSALLVLCCVVVYGDNYRKCTRYGLECPPYRVIDHHEGFELRRYPSMSWATVEGIVSSLQGPTVVNMHKKLDKYFKDSNMPFTYPTRTMSTSFKGNNKFKMSYMIPSKFYHQTPEPKDPTITIEEDHSCSYYVREIPGLISFHGGWEKEARKFRNMLKSIEDVDTTKYYRCTFDQWWRAYGRRNEIWMAQK